MNDLVGDGPLRSAPAPLVPSAADRTLPSTLRRAVLLAGGGHLGLGLVLACVAQGLLALAVGLGRLSEGYDAIAVGTVASCTVTWRDNGKDGPQAYAAATYYVTVDGANFGGDFERRRDHCPATGSQLTIKYFPSEPRKSSPAADIGEYRPIGHVVAGAGSALAWLFALGLLRREWRRRRRVLRVLRTGYLVNGQLRGVGAKRMVDFWGTQEHDVEFALPGELELIGTITVSTTTPVRVMDGETEALLLEPPLMRHAVAVDTVPGKLRVSADAIVDYQPPPRGAGPALLLLLGAATVAWLVLLVI